jgi:hypothetical protein
MTVEVYWQVEPGVGGWPAPDDRYQWVIEIDGRPSARVVIDLPTPADGSYDPGFYGTMGTAVNAIGPVCDAEPGILHQPVFAPWRPATST